MIGSNVEDCNISIEAEFTVDRRRQNQTHLPQIKPEFWGEFDVSEVVPRFFGTLSSNDAFERTEDPERACEGLFSDPLAYYLPYHFNSNSWGIYFRQRKIASDFKTFSNRLHIHFNRQNSQMDYFAFVSYIRLIYFHELSHHIIEDIATVKNLYGVSMYPLLNKQEEEGFCEFTGFTSQSRANNPFKLLPENDNKIFGSSRGLFPQTAGFTERQFNKKIVEQLYVYWGRVNDPIYRPIV